MTVGQRIKELRVSCNMTQDDLAEVLNCNREKISNYENDKFQYPDCYFLNDIAQYFKVSLDYFFKKGA